MGSGATKVMQDQQLIQAASDGNGERCLSMIAQGADVNAKMAVNQWTPLHYAAREGHGNVIEVLLSAGADSSLTSKVRCTDLPGEERERGSSLVTMLENLKSALNSVCVCRVSCRLGERRCSSLKIMERKGSSDCSSPTLDQNPGLWLLAQLRSQIRLIWGGYLTKGQLPQQNRPFRIKRRTQPKLKPG